MGALGSLLNLDNGECRLIQEAENSPTVNASNESELRPLIWTTTSNQSTTLGTVGSLSSSHHLRLQVGLKGFWSDPKKPEHVKWFDKPLLDELSSSCQPAIQNQAEVINCQQTAKPKHLCLKVLLDVVVGRSTIEAKRLLSNHLWPNQLADAPLCHGDLLSLQLRE
jgi:hypothetical protein